MLYPRLLALVDYELLQLLLVTVCELGEVEICSCSAGKGRVHDKKNCRQDTSTEVGIGDGNEMQVKFRFRVQSRN